MIGLKCLYFQQQTDSGYADAIWTVPTAISDGQYELAIQVLCKASVARGLPGEDSFISPSVFGLIDRTPPAQFGQGLRPSNNFYFPGDEISVTFNEQIDCSRPYNFMASLSIPRTKAAPAKSLAAPLLNAFCNENKISFEFTSSSGIAVCELKCFLSE